MIAIPASNQGLVICHHEKVTPPMPHRLCPLSAPMQNGTESPAPPEAMIGTDTASEMVLVNSIS